MKHAATTPMIEKKAIEKKDHRNSPKASEAEVPEGLHQAISDGISEYRRQIAAIRARHGRQNRRMIHSAN